MRFRGVLVRLDEASNKPPNGSEGHKILVPSEVAKKRLGTLIGMGLNYSPSLDGHAQKRKVGVIEKAWIDGKDLWVSGNVWKHDFPEAEQDLKQRGLGMSMEIGQVHVEDVEARIWKLTDFYFLGGTILWKDAAAYHQTQAIAAKADERSYNMAEKPVKKTGLSAKQIAEIAAKAASEAVGQSMQALTGIMEQQMEVLTAIRAAVDPDAEKIDGADGEVDDIKTKDTKACNDGKDVKAKGGDDEPDGDEDMDDEDDADEEEMESEVDKGDLSDMGPAEEEEPGKMNKDTKNKGAKTTSEDKTGPTVSKAVTGAGLAQVQAQINKLSRRLAEVTAENLKLKKRLHTVDKQVAASAAETNRRSLSPEITGLLVKSNLDPLELRASGQKLTAQEWDGIILNSHLDLDVTKRMSLKNELVKAGLMEEGRVDRGFGLR